MMYGLESLYLCTDMPYSFNYGMIMQPLQSELVMRSINMLAEKYSHDRNRVELLQPYLGDTSCLSKVGKNTCMFCVASYRDMYCMTR